MRTIIKNEDGTYWVRLFGRFIGNFKSISEAKNATK